MFLLLLTLFLIAGSLGIALYRHFEKPLQTINASLFLSLFIVIYSPQLSSLLLGSLSLDKLLITAISITFLFVVCFTRFFTKLSLPSFDKSSIKEIFQGNRIYLPLFLTLILASTFVSTWAIQNLCDFGFDGYAYHTSAMAWFNQYDSITNEIPFIPWVTAYPKNIEFLSLWIYKFDGNDQYIEAGNLIVHLMVIPFAFGIGRLAGLSKSGSIIASFIYFLTPISLTQLRSTYIDQAFADCTVMAIYFLLSWIKHFADSISRETMFMSLLLGLSVGSLAQIKGSGLHLWIILALMTIPLFLLENKGRLDRVFCLRAAKYLMLSFLLALACGTGWYIKNHFVHGNPFWPMQLKLPLWGEIFPGITIEQLILNNWGVGDRGWLDIYWQQFTENLSRPLDIDNRTGGLGFHFFSLGLPCLAICLLFGNSIVRWLACFAIAYFFIVPATFWPRYSIATTLTTAIATIWVSEKIITNASFQNTFKLFSFFTVTLSILPQFNSFAITQDRYVFKEWCGKRYSIIEDFGPTTIALCNLLSPDEGMWYYYFGERWQNKIVKFDKDKMGEYPFIACRMQKQFEFLDNDQRFALINTDTTFLDKGEVGEISLYMNLSHPDINSSHDYQRYIPVEFEENQTIVKVGNHGFFEKEINILNGKKRSGNFTRDLTEYSIPNNASLVQLTIKHLGISYPNGEFKYYLNADFLGGHQIHLNHSDKSQSSSETFWCPVIEGKIYISVKSKNDWVICLHGYSM